MDKYENYDQESIEIIKQNEEVFALFEKSLQELSPKTRKNHLSNVDFFINDYLLYYDALSYKAGLSEIEEYLGDFFISKYMWSNPASIKNATVSIRKFYKCMSEHGKIKVEEYNHICDVIKRNMKEWQKKCKYYNYPNKISF